MKELLEIVDQWLATVADFRPFGKKAIYSAKLAESEKDIFVDTLLLSLEPKTPHRKITVSTAVYRESGLATNTQRCCTSPPLYVVSRLWSDDSNPVLTLVQSVEILIISHETLSVRFELEDSRATKATLNEFKGVIHVNLQQGEVAELVLALTKCGPLSMLQHLQGKHFRHYSINTQTCARLFCEYSQRINTSMAELIWCAGSSNKELITKLYAGLWHYSMPQNSSLWDIEHLLDCFRFQSKLAPLANDSP
ncbi:hypothetical protein SUNI508_11178 [Seiridium unicorne]|uniref:Uncharacterized protein n=1 Tax=Seiridium unicorne TaxID=138068 RepID=A0ABR2UIM8_9PEZI